MSIDQLASFAAESINNTPKPMKPTIVLMMPGKWGKTNKRTLNGEGSPVGDIVEETKQGIRVIFCAIDVLAYCVAHGAKVNIGPHKAINNEY